MRHTTRAVGASASGTGTRAVLKARLKNLHEEFAVYRSESENDQLQQIDVQRDLELAAHRYADLFDFAPVAYLLLDRNGFIREANLTATQMFGLDRKKLCGTILTNYVTPRHKEKFRAHLKLCGLNQPVRQNVTELDLITRDNRKLVVQLFSIREDAGEMRIRENAGEMRIRTAVVDVTERKCAEQVIVQLNNSLEDHVAERTAELDQTVERLKNEAAQRTHTQRQLEQSNRELRLRSDQLRLLAHELIRTEQRERRRLARVLHDHLQQLIVATRVQAEMLRKQSFPRSTPAELEKIASLLDESQGVCRLLAVDLYPPVLHHGGLHEALKWLSRWIAENHNLKVRLKLHAQLPPDTEGWSAFLYQTVRELLFNVRKHAGVKTAEVTLDRAKGRVQITVADNGAGFDTEKMGSFSKPTGFGLFSIRERLQLMGGKIHIHSAPGRGTRISLDVPEPKPQKSAKVARLALDVAVVAPKKPSEAGHKIRVLLVDDHKILRDSLSNLLNTQPDVMVAGEAANGREAIRQTRKLRPDVVVMDVHMPVMDGIQATRVISEELPSVRVVGLSLDKQADSGAAILRAGATGFVHKGAASVKLLSAIRQAAQPAA